MCGLFEDWKQEIIEYCEQNGLSFDKVREMAQAWGKDELLLQYHDPQKGNKGLLDETPAPIVLIMQIKDGTPVFIQTEYTKKHLRLD